MNRYRHRPGLLPGAVASACHYESTGLRPGEHRGLPSPWLTFIVSVDAPVRVAGTVGDAPADWRRATAYDVVVAGLHPVAARVEQPAEQRGVQLAVHPLAAPALLGCRAGELRAAADHGLDVLGRQAAALHGRVADARTPEERLDVVQGWLRDRLTDRPAHRVRPEVVHAWRLVLRSGGRVRVEDLAREVALSPRQLGAVMHREAGLSPKQLCRLVRFDAAVAGLAGGVPVAAVAAAAGFADQSHLTREFRAMTGATPTAWLAEERRNIQDGGHRNRPDSPS